MKFEQISNQACKILDQPVELLGGIHSFKTPRFYMVLMAYLFATMFLISDPFFGGSVFYYRQGSLTIFLAIILVSTFAWEMMILGPVSGANFLLQVLLIVPSSLLIARMLGAPSEIPPPDPSVLQGIWDSVKQFSRYVGLYEIINSILEMIPAIFRDMFRNPKVLILIIIVLFTLCFKSVKVRCTIMGILFVLIALTAISENCSWQLVLALITMSAGLWMEYCPYQKVVVYKNAIRAMSIRPQDYVAMRAMVRIFNHGLEEKKVGEETVREITKSEYTALHPYNANEIRLISAELTKKLIYEFNVLELRGDKNGLFLEPNPKLQTGSHFLGYISVGSRMFFAVALAVIWSLMPIDLIPDAIPCIGFLDDMVVTTLAFFICRNSVEMC